MSWIHWLLVAAAFPVARIAVPYLLAGTGGIFSERGGVINIALEGFLLAGAFGGAVGASLGGPWAGVALGMGAGLALAALYAACVITLRADQIVSGVAINLLADGATRFLLKVVWRDAASSAHVAAAGAGVPILVVAFLAVAAAQLVMFRTPFGLRLRASGDHPMAALTLGIRVPRVRATGVLIAGALAGLGGVWLCYSAGRFASEMSGGRGYIALAAMVMGSWRPLRVFAACLFFAAVEALAIHLHAIPPSLANVLPHALTILVLAGAVGRSRPPAALGQPLEPLD